MDLLKDNHTQPLKTFPGTFSSAKEYNNNNKKKQTKKANGICEMPFAGIFFSVSILPDGFVVFMVWACVDVLKSFFLFFYSFLSPSRFVDG